MKRLGRYTLLFERRPAILGHAAEKKKPRARWRATLTRRFSILI